MSAGVLPYFCNLLDSKDWNTVIVVLDGLSNLLHTAAKMGEETNLAIMIEEIGALDKIERLQSHENEQVYMKSMALIDAYFTEKVCIFFMIMTQQKIDYRFNRRKSILLVLIFLMFYMYFIRFVYIINSVISTSLSIKRNKNCFF